MGHTKEEQAKMDRYEKEILPEMGMDQLLNALVQAEIANQNIDGHQYMELSPQIKMIRAEITSRVA